MRFRNLRNRDGIMDRHVLWPFAWRDFISLLIKALLPAMVKEGEEPNQRLTYQRYCLARMEDGCMLCPHRGRQSERHGPIYMRAIQFVMKGTGTDMSVEIKNVKANAFKYAPGTFTSTSVTPGVYLLTCLPSLSGTCLADLF